MIVKIAFAGAPCSGKSRVIPFVKERLLSDGCCTGVFTVSEAATELINSGLDPQNRYLFQSAVFDRVYCNEEIISAYCTAAADPESSFFAVLEDRCLCDGSAYLSPFEWQKLKDEKGVTEESLVSRYDFFVHLKSVVTLDKSLFETETGNTKRSESPDETVRLEELASDIYDRRPSSVIIPAQERFEDKIKLTQDAVSAFVCDVFNNRFNKGN